MTARTWPALVLLQPDRATTDVPIAEVNAELARRIVEQFGDDVLHLIGVPGPAEDRTSAPGQAHVRTFTLPADPSAANEAVLAAVSAFARPYAYTVLDVSSRSQGFTNQLVLFLGSATLPAGLHRRLVRLRRTEPPFVSAVGELDAPGWSVLAAVFVDPPAQPSHPLEQTARAAVDRVLTRMGRRPPKTGVTRPNPAPGPRREEFPEEVRVRTLWGPTATDVSWARFARAVTRRRVGLALGGSGAWGFSHVALIQKLLEAGLPIDILASASSGSVIAGYYAALGTDGLETVLNRGWRLDLAVLGCVFDMASLEFMVGLDTGFPALDQLEVMFFPVTTNLTTMSPDRVVSASLPWGVRASSTAPGLFAATATADAVYADGAVTDNVPAELVQWLGAELIVASNALPAPADIKRPCDVKLALDPFFRVREFAASLSLMFHDVGDWESVGFITYDPPQTAYPLARTFMFNAAKSVYQQTLEQSEFQLAIRRSRAAWEQLSRARTGL